MIILLPYASLPSCTTITCFKPFSHNNHFVPSSTVPLLVSSNARTWTFFCSARSRRKNLNHKDFDIDIIKEEQEREDDDDGGFPVQGTHASQRKNLNGKDFDIDIIKEELELEDDDGGGFSAQGIYARREAKDNDTEEVQENEDDDGGFSGRGPYRGRQEKDYDRDPEFAEIIGSYLDDPQKAQSKVEERVRKKRNKILHTKTGSGVPMKVSVNKFDFSNSYIWLEFYNAPLAKDISLICDAIRGWHIVGRLGGCNSMNMQLSQSPMDKQPSYDFIQGANVTPTTFYNMGDLEVQDNLARIWVDIGTSEPLLLDVLINALTQISSDYVGIKQVMFGGEEFENWKENLTSEDSGFSVHKI